MSDNQSENSQQWGAGPLDDGSLDDVAAAEAAVKIAQDSIWHAEEALEEAKRTHTRAKGFLEFIKSRPTWKQILVPTVDMTMPYVYTACMQLGYSFALVNGKIYKAGLPGEQMMDTGMREEDIT